MSLLVSSYVAILVNCKAGNSDTERNISAVSLVIDRCARPQSLLYVHKRQQPWRPTYNFTLCPVPFYLNYNSVAQLVQYIEVNSVFGADNFIFYNYSSSHVINPYLDYYTSIGKATVIQWKLPIYGECGKYCLINSYGHVISLNDCILRAMLTSRYVASLDTDEVLLPLKKPDWLSLIKQYGDSHTAGYLFANTFFLPNQTNPRFENLDLMKQYPMAPLLLTTRDKKIFPHTARNKYLARPEHVTSSMIHKPMLQPGYKSKPIAKADGILAHYRSSVLLGRHGDVNVTRMHDFSDEILRRVAVVAREVRRFM